MSRKPSSIVFDQVGDDLFFWDQDFGDLPLIKTPDQILLPTNK
jgi:hypothetical protein